MSEQEFKGLDPRSAVGKSIYFYSLDAWIDIHHCINMIMAVGLPPYPILDAETAVYLAEKLQERLDFGLVHAYYELEAKSIFPVSETSDSDGLETDSDEDEASEFVESRMDFTQRFIDFLKDSGGCMPV
jgi:hypothetical protein